MIRASISLIALLFGVALCQVHYVPVNAYIPVNPYQIGWNNSYYNYNNKTSNNSSWTGPGHIFWGKIGPLDRLLFNEMYFKDSHWWTSREKIIEYPKDVQSGYVRHETISAIHIINKFYQGNHANASILSGGVGRQFVKIRLASTWGYGLKFLVQIFGH
ncbi:uncharacterized protein LOC123673205 [Harmonia axyridis]|uniref:uncharacterized protein LOC123673205 n=1 Tax=Harmonia axyridis TaxID=115357 RepID=UPI001E2764BA|nr:uncharacterized protein LOC123673205 [Harmonia axyridis]XP_045463623.1 uncharacterized protein LOC123673205 [Harmonia axyridis]